MSIQIWNVLLLLYPQGAILPLLSLNDFWQMFIKLPHRYMNFWGTLLAIVLWSIWLLRNQTIFRPTRIIPVNNLYFSIFYLFSL
jgi:hypothetical protein